MGGAWEWVDGVGNGRREVGCWEGREGARQEGEGIAAGAVLLSFQCWWVGANVSQAAWGESLEPPPLTLIGLAVFVQAGLAHRLLPLLVLHLY